MNSFDIVWSFIKMISALAIILGLLLASMYFFKRFMRHTGTGPDQGELIRVVTSRYLGPKSSIMLVDIAGQIVAVGIAGNQMTPLATISDPAALERIKHVNAGGPSMPSFAEHLMNYRGKLRSLTAPGTKRTDKNQNDS
jgi:flagellar biosynthetic protein FliO